ncbi:hypothetical protein [Streptomyces sp. NPDC101249]|uniref:hypothetical protein n=1 Tax=Streptomyces sp. NPDC101249 TaxID=3366140 RepID=UPI00382E6618
MIANLFTVAAPAPAALRRALARALALPESAVDVADADGDQADRDWDAPVLCGYRRLPRASDIASELDVTVAPAAAPDTTERALALGLAAATGTSVLYPDADQLPSAYWVAVPDGRTVRCRLEPLDDADGDDGGPAYRVTATQEPVPDLPGATVEILPEILDREPLPTPLADAFLADRPNGPAASPEGGLHHHLRVWERLVRRLDADWRPSGHYREDLFARDLRSRDALDDMAVEVPSLRPLLAILDGVYRERTVGEPSGAGDREPGWWHARTPGTLPW